MAQCPQDRSFLLRAGGILKQLLPEYVDVITAFDQFHSLLGFDELTKEVARGLDHLVFLWKNLDFEYYLLQEGLQSLAGNRALVGTFTLSAESLVCLLAEFAVVLAKLEMHSIPNDLELVSSKLIVHVANLGLFADISLDPLRLHGLLALMINKLTTKLETGTDEICAFQRKL